MATCSICNDGKRLTAHGLKIHMRKVHADPLFEKYLIREHPRLLRDNYQMKSTAEQTGVEEHGN